MFCQLALRNVKKNLHNAFTSRTLKEKKNFDKILVMIMYGHTQVLFLSQLSSFLHAFQIFKKFQRCQWDRVPNPV